MTESSIVFYEGDDSEIVAAAANARATFRYFWNQVSLDFNRIVPALELACVKVPFSDDDSDTELPVEQMWVSQINFDGVQVSGLLINEPNHLKSVSEEDEVSFPVSRISDWLCVLNGQVYGGYSIQVLRSRMLEAERAAHDEAWGLDFSFPDTVQVPEHDDKFEEVLASLLAEQIAKDPSTVATTFEQGRTILHLEALYGRAPSVRVLLQHGADASVCCDRGWSVHDYAESLDWEHIIRLLDNFS